MYRGVQRSRCLHHLDCFDCQQSAGNSAGDSIQFQQQHPVPLPGSTWCSSSSSSSCSNSQTVLQSAAPLPSSTTVHVWIVPESRLEVKRLRASLGVHFPQSEYRNLSEKVFGAQSDSGAQAMSCLRVLQHTHRSQDLHPHTDSKRSHDIVWHLKQYDDRQRRSPTRQKLVPCDIWALVYDALQQCTVQTLWPHQYGHNQCSFNDKADALTKQAAAPPPPAAKAMCIAKTKRAFGPLGIPQCPQ